MPVLLRQGQVRAQDLIDKRFHRIQLRRLCRR
jgi:hypothetical protein